MSRSRKLARLNAGFPIRPNDFCDQADGGHHEDDDGQAKQRQTRPETEDAARLAGRSAATLRPMRDFFGPTSVLREALTFDDSVLLGDENGVYSGRSGWPME